MLLVLLFRVVNTPSRENELLLVLLSKYQAHALANTNQDPAYEHTSNTDIGKTQSSSKKKESYHNANNASCSPVTPTQYVTPHRNAASKGPYVRPDENRNWGVGGQTTNNHSS
jgi:hypothetical protein